MRALEAVPLMHLLRVIVQEPHDTVLLGLTLFVDGLFHMTSSECSWKLKYTDNYVENVGIDALNQALQRRYDHNHGEAGVGSTPAFQ